jgi:type VI secretion system protein ImpA
MGRLDLEVLMRPVPLLLVRVRPLVSKDFIDVLRDIAPDALAQTEAIRGRDGT